MFGVIEIGVEILGTVRHVVGHQIDVVQIGRDSLNVYPFLRTFDVGTYGDGQQFFFVQRLMQFAQ
ncbi:hypothetical protein D3C77_735260 [compost metagenome]